MLANMLLVVLSLLPLSVSAQIASPVSPQVKTVTLPEAIEVAIQHHPRLQQASIQIEQARAARGTVWEGASTSVHYAWGQLNGPDRHDNELSVEQSLGSFITPIYRNALVHSQIQTQSRYLGRRPPYAPAPSRKGVAIGHSSFPLELLRPRSVDSGRYHPTTVPPLDRATASLIHSPALFRESGTGEEMDVAHRTEPFLPGTEYRLFAPKNSSSSWTRFVDGRHLLPAPLLAATKPEPTGQDGLADCPPPG